MSAARLELLPAIKRRRARQLDARADVADAALKARRPSVLARHRNTCAACGYAAKEASHLDVHHLDDDHANNDEANLVAACHTCHPYQHIGEVAVRADAWAEGLGKKSGLAHVPELSARDMNLLLRAVGAAMLDPQARDDAQEIYEELMNRTDVTQRRLGAWKAADFAAAMAQLTDEQYRYRHKVLATERLVFSQKVLEVIGREFTRDYPSLPVAAWPAVASGVAGSASSSGAPAAGSSGGLS
jgi:hypothetical protein